MNALRHGLLIGTLVLASGMLVIAIGLAGQATDIFADDAGGFEVFVAAIGILVLTSIGVGIAICWRVPGNRVGPLLIAGALLVMSIFVAWPLFVVMDAAGDVATTAVGLVAWWGNIALVPSLFVLFATIGIVFPDGHLPGPRWRIPFAMAIASLAVGMVLQTVAPWVPSVEQPVANPLALPGIPTVVSEVGGAIAAIALFGGLGLAVAGIVVRFRRSRGVERAQMKWFLAAVALLAVVFPLSFATDIGPADLIDVGSVLVGTLLPLAIGVAILRYRLYEIDRLVSRTVAWAVITGILVAVFGGGVLALQALLSDVTQGQTLAVAASTLLAFALFQPVRRRVQRAVDRRFDRARVDGQEMVEAFATEVRNEVDLRRLRQTLASTAEEAVRPVAATVWLRRSVTETTDPSQP